MTGLSGTTVPRQSWALPRLARFPGLRALAWHGDILYGSRGYELLRTKVADPSANLSWESVASFHPSLRARLLGTSRLTARLFRDGFHALAVLPSGALVAAVPGAIITLRPGETEFVRTHTITRGTRPLHITAVPAGTVFWGEYFDNPSRDEVHIYASTDDGLTWSVAYTFLKGAIRHVHNIVHDPWENCLWVLTGDNGDECRILCASCDFSRVEAVLQGNQQARAVALVPTASGLYFSTDTPLELNDIYRLGRRGEDRQGDDRQGENRDGSLSRLSAISSSSIYGCRVGSQVFFSTMVEPSEVNRDPHVRIYGGRESGEQNWRPLLAWRKDGWPMGLFQYGNAFLPDGVNTTPYLAVTTVAVENDDTVTSLYHVGF
jgi:hypothetical protein